MKILTLSWAILAIYSCNAMESLTIAVQGDKEKQEFQNDALRVAARRDADEGPVDLTQTKFLAPAFDDPNWADKPEAQEMVNNAVHKKTDADKRLQEITSAKLQLEEAIAALQALRKDRVEEHKRYTALAQEWGATNNNNAEKKGTDSDDNLVREKIAAALKFESLCASLNKNIAEKEAEIEKLTAQIAQLEGEEATQVERHDMWVDKLRDAAVKAPHRLDARVAHSLPPVIAAPAVQKAEPAEGAANAAEESTGWCSLL